MAELRESYACDAAGLTEEGFLALMADSLLEDFLSTAKEMDSFGVIAQLLA